MTQQAKLGKVGAQKQVSSADPGALQNCASRVFEGWTPLRANLKFCPNFVPKLSRNCPQIVKTCHNGVCEENISFTEKDELISDGQCWDDKCDMWVMTRGIPLSHDYVSHETCIQKSIHSGHYIHMRLNLRLRKHTWMHNARPDRFFNTHFMSKMEQRKRA